MDGVSSMAQLDHQTIQLNGLDFVTHVCQYNGSCQKFSSQLTIPVALTVGGIPVGAKMKLNTCMFGGGCACEVFVKLNDMERY
jgi:hypothetical protein